MRLCGNKMANAPFQYLSTLLCIALLSILWGCDNNEPKDISSTCNDPIGCVEIAPTETIKIGVLQALSGDIATLGQEQIRGLKLFLDSIDNKLYGHNIELQTEDTGCTSEGGGNAALKVIADPRTIAIMGTTCSSAAASASHAMSQAGLTMVSGNNSAPFLTSMGGKKAPDWHPGYFRTAANEENAGKAAALYAYRQLNIRTVATINDGDIYTKGLTEGFRQTFEALGGEVVFETSISKGDLEMSPVLEGVTLSHAQLLFFPLFQPEGNHILLQARRMPSFENIILMSDGALIESSFIEDVQDAGKGMYFVGPAPPPPSVAATLLAQQYQSTFQTVPSAIYYVNAFDAASILFEALRNSTTVKKDNSLTIGRQALRDALHAIDNFPGLTGPLSCDSFGDCTIPRFNILRLDNPQAGLEGLQHNIMSSLSPTPAPQ